MHPRSVVHLVALLSLVVAGHAAEVVGTAGTITIDTNQVRALGAGLPAHTPSEVARGVASLEQLVRADLTTRAVIAEADAAGFGKRAEVAATLEQVRNEALAQLWLGDLSRPPAGYPSDTEIASAYEQNKGQLVTP